MYLTVSFDGAETRVECCPDCVPAHFAPMLEPAVLHDYSHLHCTICGASAQADGAVDETGEFWCRDCSQAKAQIAVETYFGQNPELAAGALDPMVMMEGLLPHLKDAGEQLRQRRQAGS